jgi:hypothetical protein
MLVLVEADLQRVVVWDQPIFLQTTNKINHYML